MYMLKTTKNAQLNSYKITENIKNDDKIKKKY